MEAANQGYDLAQSCALDVYMNIAGEGDTGAMYNVGGLCLKGWGGEQDKNVCLKWLEGAARLGHIRSGEMLNKIYAKGMFGITPDEEKAAEWIDVVKGFKKGIDGKWEGSISMEEDFPPMVLAYDFRRDGNKLTGTTPGFGGQEIQIQDGKIDGKDFSFKVKTSSGGTKTTTDYKGEFYGDFIKLTFVTKTSAPRDSGPGSTLRSGGGGESPPMTFIAKRSEL